MSPAVYFLGGLLIWCVMFHAISAYYDRKLDKERDLNLSAQETKRFEMFARTIQQNQTTGDADAR